jgi:hypothetical protein
MIIDKSILSNVAMKQDTEVFKKNKQTSFYEFGYIPVGTKIDKYGN